MGSMGEDFSVERKVFLDGGNPSLLLLKLGKISQVKGSS